MKKKLNALISYKTLKNSFGTPFYPKPPQKTPAQHFPKNHLESFLSLHAAVTSSKKIRKIPRTDFHKA